MTEQVLEGDTVYFELERDGAGQRLGAPVQVTEQVKEGDIDHVNPSKMVQVKEWELQFMGGDPVHLELDWIRILRMKRDRIWILVLNMGRFRILLLGIDRICKTSFGNRPDL